MARDARPEVAGTAADSLLLCAVLPPAACDACSEDSEDRAIGGSADTRLCDESCTYICIAHLQLGVISTHSVMCDWPSAPATMGLGFRVYPYTQHPYTQHGQPTGSHICAGAGGAAAAASRLAARRRQTRFSGSPGDGDRCSRGAASRGARRGGRRARAARAALGGSGGGLSGSRGRLPGRRGSGGGVLARAAALPARFGKERRA